MTAKKGHYTQSFHRDKMNWENRPKNGGNETTGSGMAVQEKPMTAKTLKTFCAQLDKRYALRQRATSKWHRPETSMAALRLNCCISHGTGPGNETHPASAPAH